MRGWGGAELEQIKVRRKASSLGFASESLATRVRGYASFETCRRKILHIAIGCVAVGLLCGELGVWLLNHFEAGATSSPEALRLSLYRTLA
jgi:NhaP-type Na+/H+ or K+/H+ antiporter